MTDEIQKKVQDEYDRIKAGPHSGFFTFLHHEGPIVEESKDVMERVEYILRDKPFGQLYVRLRHIYPVPATALKAYQEATATALKAYREATATALKAYQEATATALKAYREAIAPAEKAYREAIAPALKAYLEAIAPAEKAYQGARATALKAYQEATATAEKTILALIPNCAWNGSSILPWRLIV